MLHGTQDPTVPYVNGLAVGDRAKAVGLPSSDFITLPGAGHVPWDDIFAPDVWNRTMWGVVDALDLRDAWQPPGCGSA